MKEITYSAEIKMPKPVRKNASKASRIQSLQDRLGYLEKMASHQCQFVRGIPWHDTAHKTYHELKRDMMFEMIRELKFAMETLEIPLDS